MSFHDIRFPENISFGSTGGPERRTEVITLANGHEVRNARWADSRRRYDAGLGVRTLNDLAAVLAFFEARHGRLFGFRWKDWADCKSCAPLATPSPTDVPLGVGDGLTMAVQLTKTYISGPGSYTRDITKPVVGTLEIAIDGAPQADGSDFTVDPLTGIVTFAAPPAAGAILTAGFEFDVPARFDSDSIETSLSGFETGEIPSIPIVELRV